MGLWGAAKGLAKSAQKTVRKVSKAATKGTPLEGLVNAATKATVKDIGGSFARVTNAAVPLAVGLATGQLSAAQVVGSVKIPAMEDVAKMAAQDLASSLIPAPSAKTENKAAGALFTTPTAGPAPTTATAAPAASREDWKVTIRFSPASLGGILRVS